MNTVIQSSIPEPTLCLPARTNRSPIDELTPSKKAPDGVMATRKFKQIVSSIREIGLIEPRSGLDRFRILPVADVQKLAAETP
jgi:hypothetical protein